MRYPGGRPIVAVAAVLAGLLLCTVPVGAHDMWIAPVPTEGSKSLGALDLRFVIGHGKMRKRYGRTNRRILRFEILRAQGGAPRVIAGADGQRPAGRLTGLDKGSYAVVYHGKPAHVTMTIESFRAYLRTEGDDRALRLLKSLGSRGDQRESYARHLKALIRVAPGTPWRKGDLNAGLSFEFLVQSDPFVSSGPLRLQLMHRGVPSVGTRVRAFRADGSGSELTARTDTEGRVSLTLPTPSRHLWVIAAVHMSLNPDGRWHSDWTALSLRR